MTNYTENFEVILLSVLFFVFKISIIVLTILIIISLLLLIFGCLIKSEKIKLKFLKVTPSLLFTNFILLSIPIIVWYFKN